ncbi:sensor histidine kinase [Actinomadura alba]|uniref:histidine kinase n=1 Tax=Actinomadura alba TaxID=406431 RepID=A0ABR7LSE6_9ACTN|nr:sensor histidine kinase [Actinomadura alba]MBC6467353.1 sensor domain-containing protein [Actinomadura alba]
MAGTEPDGHSFLRDMAARAVREPFKALEDLAGGLGTSLLALLTLVFVLAIGALCLVGIGLPLVSRTLRLVHAVAGRERARLVQRGHEIIDPYPPGPPTSPVALTEPATRRDLGWLVLHATAGLILGLIGVLLPIFAFRDTTFPLWWRLIPDGEATAGIGIPVDGWTQVLAVGLMGLAWFAVTIGLGPGIARLQAAPGLRLLGPHPGLDLSARVAELSATRAAALESHAAELRRIERSLHDGAQNRLVGVVVLVGAARRALAKDAALAENALERAQTAAEEALEELRGVARAILPPVLEQRGLDGALSALAAQCSVPCRLTVDLPGACPASVQATAYFVAAEALTNVSRHSHARHATVDVRRHTGRLRIRVTDDGHGGAHEDGGTGIAGIRSRAEAHDGSMTLSSPPGGPTAIEVELPCA